VILLINLSSDTVCLLRTCYMCDVLNIAILNRIYYNIIKNNIININSKEVLLIAEDTIVFHILKKEKQRYGQIMMMIILKQLGFRNKLLLKLWQKL